MVARMLVECGVPSACMTSLSTIYPSLRAPSGYRATGFSTQSELLPSACMVELPSKPQLGTSASVGGFSNALSRLLPRRSGTGFLPSSQMYSSLYFVMVFGGSLGKAELPQTGQGRTGLLSLRIKSTCIATLGPIKSFNRTQKHSWMAGEESGPG